MRHLALILAAAAFTLAGLGGTAGACEWTQTVQGKGKGVVASADGGASTPVAVPQQPKSGS